MAFDQKKYKQDFNKKTYKRIPLDFKKEFVEKFQAKLVQEGIKQTDFFREKMEEFLGVKENE